jgi:hypothetical protein
MIGHWYAKVLLILLEYWHWIRDGAGALLCWRSTVLEL